MPSTPTENRFRSCIWKAGDNSPEPDASPAGRTIRISDAHPDVIREFVFFDKWSVDEGLMRLGLSNGRPLNKSWANSTHPSVRLSHNFAERTRETLRNYTVTGPFVPAGTAVLLHDKVYLGAPVHVFDTVLFRVMYPKTINYDWHGIARDGIRGARLLRTNVDERSGTYSVQFWERVPWYSRWIGRPRVHLIYGLDREDAEAWRVALTPAPEKARPLPMWAATRGTLETCRVSAVWQLASLVASLVIVAGPFIPFFLRMRNIDAMPLVIPVASYVTWKALFRRIARSSREWYARVISEGTSEV